MSKPDVVPVKREVIGKKLLAALDDKEKCAIICSKEDLDILIRCIGCVKEIMRDIEPATHEKTADMHRDLCELRKQVFGD